MDIYIQYAELSYVLHSVIRVEFLGFNVLLALLKEYALR